MIFHVAKYTFKNISGKLVRPMKQSLPAALCVKACFHETPLVIFTLRQLLFFFALLSVLVFLCCE